MTDAERCAACGSMIAHEYAVHLANRSFHSGCLENLRAEVSSPERKVIAVDFDGTCVEHWYPQTGPDVPGAVDVLRELASLHRLVLHTVRCGPELKEAERWFIDRGIELWAVNDNPKQLTYSDSRKVHANLYIDDAALGCPLVVVDNDTRYVDWTEVRVLLEDLELLEVERGD